MRKNAGIVLIVGGKLLLVLAEKYAGNPKKNWSVPKGRIDDDESPFAAAKRELQEEAGIDLDGHGIAESDCAADVLNYERDGKRARLHYFVVKLDRVSVAALPVGEEHEHVAGIGFFDADTACEIITKPQRRLVHRYLTGD